MRIENLINSFPELSNLDESSRLELLENARYETFVRSGSNATWATGYFLLFVVAVICGVAVAVALKLLMEPSVVVMGTASGAVGAVVGLYSQRRWYIHMLSPKVSELVSGDRFNKALQQTEETAAE